jgi:regulator of protease activity HflC (stomatin/prohibitin superfamily)
MLRFNALRLGAMIGGLVAIALLAAAISIGTMDVYFGLGFLFIGGGLFIGTAIAEVQANPPQKGIPMVSGSLINHLLPASWYFVPFRGKVFVDIIPVTGEEIPVRWTIEIRTPDNHFIAIPFFIYFRVDDSNPVEFLVAGNLDAVTQKIKDQIEEILREWITSPTKGPQTWREARRATEETLNTVLESLFATDLNKVNNLIEPFGEYIPTEILFKHYFPPQGLTQEEERRLIEKKLPWEDKLRRLPREVPPALQRRRDIIADARNGHMDEIGPEFRAAICGLGILVTRIGLSNIEPTGKTAEGVDNVALAQLDKEKAVIVAEKTTIEGEQFHREVRAMNDIIPDGREARRAVSVRQKLTKEEVTEKQISISPQMTDAVREIGMAIVNAILGRRGGPQ